MDTHFSDNDPFYGEYIDNDRIQVNVWSSEYKSTYFDILKKAFPCQMFKKFELGTPILRPKSV